MLIFHRHPPVTIYKIYVPPIKCRELDIFYALPLIHCNETCATYATVERKKKHLLKLGLYQKLYKHFNLLAVKIVSFN